MQYKIALSVKGMYDEEFNFYSNHKIQKYTVILCKIVN